MFTDKPIATELRKLHELEIQKGNRIILEKINGEKEVVSSIKNVSLEYFGKNSLIYIREPFNIAKCKMFVGENAYVEFGKNLCVRFSLSIDLRRDNTTIKFGNNANIGNVQIFAGDEPDLEVIIGDNFLSAINLIIRSADGHTIIDKNTLKILNQPQFGVHIGNNVWTGLNVTILKDVNIPDNVVVAAGAIISKKSFESNSIIGGIPAKTIKKNIIWDKKTIHSYITNL